MAEITGTAGADILIGTVDDDIIDALAGDDESYAGPGNISNDIVSGGDGDDRLGAGAGDDIVLGDNHDGVTDLGAVGDDGSNELFGGDGNDLLITGGYSNDGTDASLAGAINNAYDGMITGTGNSIAWGGSGNDIVYGAGGDDTLGGGDGNDEINGGAGNDVIYGGADSGVDILRGGAGNDLIFNGGGNDIVNGGDGNDTMWGGAGDDMITTGAGADVVGFISGNGNDTVTDFTLGEDILELSSTGLFADASAVIAAMTDTPNGVVLTIDANTSVTFTGLTVEDFRTTTGNWVNASGTPEGSPAGSTFIYTEGADNFMGAVGDDEFVGGTISGNNNHTVGTADIANGGGGQDTLRVILENDGIIPTISNIETVSAQALGAGGSSVSLVNATDVETLENDRSTDDLSFSNVQAPVDVIVNDAVGNTDVGFANNAANNAAMVQDVELNNTSNTISFDYASGAAPATLSAVFNNSGAAGINFAGPDGNTVTTVDLELNGGTFDIIDGATLSGLNGSDALSSLMLSGSADVTSARANSGGVFNDLTNVDATELSGSLVLDQLNADTGMNFLGGNGQTTVIGSNALGANNTVVFGTDDNDRLVQSSTNLNGDDLAADAAGTSDIWEVHHNDVAPIDYSGGPFLDAANNTFGFENLVVDVWTNSSEDVLIDNAALMGDFTTITVQDTFEDGNPTGAGIVDENINDVTINGLDDTRNVVIAANTFGDISLNAAAGSGPLQLHLLGSDDAASGTVPGGIGNDIGGTNIDVTGAELDVLLNDDDADLGTVSLDAGGTVSLMGTITGAATVEVDSDGATIDASMLNTDNDVVLDPLTGFASGPNSLGASNTSVDSITVIGTEQADEISGTDSTDTLIGNGGDDVINGFDGDDAIEAGDGNDQVFVGDGIQDVDLGAGDDEVTFEGLGGSGLTSADVVNGGEGRDTLIVNNVEGTVVDNIFNNMTNLEEFTANGDVNIPNSIELVLNSIANAAGIDTVNMNAFENNTVRVNEGFVNDLTVNLTNNPIGVSDHTVTVDAIASRNVTINVLDGADTETFTVAPGGASVLTVNMDDADLDGLDTTITGGSTMDDVLNLTATGGSADASGVTGVETINLVSADTPDGADIEFTLGSADVANSLGANGGTLTISAAGMVNAAGNPANVVIDAALGGFDADSVINIIGGAGNDAIFGSENANADIINAGAGDDRINGGGAGDTLSGGAGSDEFVYNDLSDSGTGGTLSVDVITDFEDADTIMLEGMFSSALGRTLVNADLNFAGNEATFGTAQGALTANDGIIDFVYQQDIDRLWVDLNDDGTLNAQDLQITLSGASEISGNDVVAIDNLAPQIISDDTINVDENTTAVVNLLADEAVTWTITGGADQANFSIQNGNELVFNAAPDAEAPSDADTDNIFDVTVTAEDNFGNTTNQVVTVNVDDVDEFDATMPVDTDGVPGATIDENVAVGTAVGITASSSDDDVTDTVAYSLSDDAGGLFQIDANTGVVTTAMAIDREVIGASDSITVLAESSDGSSADETFTININDLNDTAPIVTQGFSIDGNDVSFTVEDADTPGPLVLANGVFNGGTGVANDGSPTTLTAQAEGSVQDYDVVVTDVVNSPDAEVGTIVEGTNGGETIDRSGNTQATAVLGFNGDDTITTGGGNDVISGGDGVDVMDGGAGADTFVFSNASESGTTRGTADDIQNFTQGDDMIDLTDLGLNLGGAVSSFVENNFEGGEISFLGSASDNLDEQFNEAITQAESIMAGGADDLVVFSIQAAQNGNFSIATNQIGPVEHYAAIDTDDDNTVDMVIQTSMQLEASDFIF